MSVQASQARAETDRPSDERGPKAPRHQRAKALIAVGLLSIACALGYQEWSEARAASYQELLGELRAPALEARRRVTALRVKVELARADAKVPPFEVAKYDMPGVVRAAEALAQAARHEASEHSSSRETELLSNLTRRSDAAARSCGSPDSFEDCVVASGELERFLQTVEAWTRPPSALQAPPAEAG